MRCVFASMNIDRSAADNAGSDRDNRNQDDCGCEKYSLPGWLQAFFAAAAAASTAGFGAPAMIFLDWERYPGNICPEQMHDTNDRREEDRVEDR